MPAVRVVGATLPGGLDLVVTIDLTGTKLTVTSALIGGVMVQVPAHLAEVPIAGAVAVTGRFTQGGAGGTVVFADFTPSGAYPVITPALDPNPTLAAPLVTLHLASVILANPGNPDAYTAARDALIAMITRAVTDAVRDAIQATRSVIATPPAILPITALTLFETPRFALTLCYRMGGPGGSTTAVGRLNVLTNTATGAPLDVAVLTLGNGGLFRDLLRPAAATALGLNASGFLPGVPFAWFGGVPLALPGGLPTGVAAITLTSLIGGIDESGRLRAIASATATGVGGSFTLDTSIDQAFTLAAGPSPTGFTLTATPAGPPVVTSDVSIAAWVYVAAALSGGSALVAVLIAIDLFAGPLISGPVGTAVAGALGPGLTITVPRPSGLPPITPRLLTSFQPDAATRTITIATLTITFPFRDHDLIVNLV
jgi:hypothetical protein